MLVPAGLNNPAYQSPKADDHPRPGDMNLLFNISSMPAVLMYAALNEQDLLCRVFGRCRHGAPIDREVGHLMQGEGLLKDRSFSYGDLRRVGRAVALDVTPEHFDAYLKAAP